MSEQKQPEPSFELSYRVNSKEIVRITSEGEVVVADGLSNADLQSAIHYLATVIYRMQKTASRGHLATATCLECHHTQAESQIVEFCNACLRELKYHRCTF